MFYVLSRQIDRTRDRQYDRQIELQRDQFTLMNCKKAKSSNWFLQHSHDICAYTDIHLFHMHTLIFHQYSPPGPPYASDSCPWGARLPWHYDFQHTNFTRHGNHPWITLELQHAFKSIQKTIKSNRTTLTIAMPSLCLMTPAGGNGKGGL